MKRPWRKAKRGGDRSGESAERRRGKSSTPRGQRDADSERGSERKDQGRKARTDAKGRESKKRSDATEHRSRKRADGKGPEAKKRSDGPERSRKARTGAEGTGKRRREEPRKIGARAVAVLTALAAALVAAARAAAKVLAGLLDRLLGPRSAPGRRLRSGLGAASEALTPTRGLLIAAIGCAILLGLSQFADYRGIAIGVDSYDPEVSSVAPVPEVDRKELGTAHSYLMIPGALIAIAILVVAVRRRRWQLCRIAALIGLLAIAIGLFVDRPAGLDEGAVADSFAGVEAQLLGGWWAQLFAGVGLIVTSLMLGMELRRAGGAQSKSRTHPSRRLSAGKRGKRDKRLARRSRPGAEGAGA